jgi:phenylalanyl-tRNA synthetase beta chain
MTYSFTGANDLKLVGEDIVEAPTVQNPLDSGQKHLRSSLVPQMLRSICDNQFLLENIRFFEIGKSFKLTSENKLPDETNWLVLGLTSDYYDAKGVIYNLLMGFGIPGDEIVTKGTNAEFLKLGMSADFFVQGKRLITIGEIREEVRGKFDIKRSVTTVTLNIDVLLGLHLPETKFEQFSKYPYTTRDVSALFTSDTTVADITSNLSRVSKLIKKIEIIDIYTGKGLQSNERSVALRFVIQSDDRTLTDEEVDEVIKTVHNKITELGGKIRSGSKT